jgi:hypothetical protein
MAMIRIQDRGSGKLHTVSCSAAAGCGNLSEVAEPREFASVRVRPYQEVHTVSSITLVALQTFIRSAQDQIMPPSGREKPVRGDRKNVLSCSECRRMKWK